MSGEKPIVLAIDDEAVILNSLLSVLAEDYTVRPFVSGQTALKYLETQSADLILIDYQMPGMSGSEVLMALQSDPRTSGIPVIFLTGSARDNIEVEVLELGAADYILKPIKPKVLVTRIRIQLELAGYRKRLEALVAEKTESLRIAFDNLKAREEITLNMLARVTDMRDHETGAHISRTTELVKILVNDLLANPKEQYELTVEEADNIIKSAKLHDIGKIAIPDHVLLKPGKLDAEEYEIIKKHATYGAYILNELISEMGADLFLSTARDIALGHQEKWNGKGYPQGLSGFEIPLSARIVAVADVYDALISTRPYKEPFSHQKAVQIIQGDSGSHFDPYLVVVFTRHEKEFDRIAQMT
ncbi:MAG: response regulator [Oscillospiraceae bacterium]|nr:response regulator [Oscillospiraceae bacterium]